MVRAIDADLRLVPDAPDAVELQKQKADLLAR